MKELKIGRLSEKPEVREVTLRDGEIKKVANAYLFVRDRNQAADENNHHPSVAVRLTAWDERADALAACNKGELVSVIGATAAVKHKNSDFTSYGMYVSSVYRKDVGIELNKQMTALLNAFERGEVSCLFDTKTEKIIEDVVQLPAENREEEITQEQEIDELEQMLSGADDFEDEIESLL